MTIEIAQHFDNQISQTRQTRQHKAKTYKFVSSQSKMSSGNDGSPAGNGTRQGGWLAGWLGAWVVGCLGGWAGIYSFCCTADGTWPPRDFCLPAALLPEIKIALRPRAGNVLGSDLVGFRLGSFRFADGHDAAALLKTKKKHPLF